MDNLFHRCKKKKKSELFFEKKRKEIFGKACVKLPSILGNPFFEEAACQRPSIQIQERKISELQVVYVDAAEEESIQWQLLLTGIKFNYLIVEIYSMIKITHSKHHLA